MSTAGEAQAKEDTVASGAKPRPEGPVRERGWRPTRRACEGGSARTEAARRRAIARGRRSTMRPLTLGMEDAMRSVVPAFRREGHWQRAFPGLICRAAAWLRGGAPRARCRNAERERRPSPTQHRLRKDTPS